MQLHWSRHLAYPVATLTRQQTLLDAGKFSFSSRNQNLISLRKRCTKIGNRRSGKLIETKSSPPLNSRFHMNYNNNNYEHNPRSAPSVFEQNHLQKKMPTKTTGINM